MNLRSTVIIAWDWAKKWDLPIKCKYLTIGREAPLRSGTPIPESNLVNDLGVQTENGFYPLLNVKKLQIKQDE